MHQGFSRFARGMVGAWVVVLAACGGGGGTETPAPPPDVRNGTYTLMAADARQYALALNFDAGTYSITGDVQQSGAISASGSSFLLSPGNSVGTSGTSTTRFSVATDAIIGEFSAPGGAVPFVAARKEVTTIAAAAGTYNLFTRLIESGTPSNTAIQQGEITAGGQLRLCNDAGLFRISDCPAASVASGTVTVSSEGFVAAFSDGSSFPFRVAQVGTDKVFLRVSAAANTSKRFMIGVPASTTAPSGTFVGGSTEPAWGTVTAGAASVTSNGVRPDGTTVSTTGTPSATVLGNVNAVSTPSSGSFFVMAGAELGVMVAARNNTLATGFMAIGKRQ